MNPLKILYNVVDSGATGSLRILRPLRRINVEIEPFSQDDIRSQLRWANLAVFQCLIGSQQHELVDKIQSSGVKVVIDYDDNFNAASPNLLKSLASTQDAVSESWQTYLRMADLITVPCQALADVVAPYARKVAVLPNYALHSEWTDALNYHAEPSSDVNILYSCSESHEDNFKWISPLLVYIGESFPQVKIITNGPFDFTYHNPDYSGRALHIPKIPFDSYLSTLRDLQPRIFIAPLLDNSRSECRSNFKFTQASLLRAAFVGSKVQPYLNYQSSCYLAKSRLGWWWYLRKLIKNPALIEGLVDKGLSASRREILEDHVHLWERVYRDLIK